MRFLPLTHRIQTLNPTNPTTFLPLTLSLLTFLLLNHHLKPLTNTYISSLNPPPNPTFWPEQARLYVYDICYNGCTTDCLDTSIISRACAKTRGVKIPGVLCDAAKMWWWDGEARFPVECLEAVGEQLRRDVKYWDGVKCWVMYLLAVVVGPCVVAYGVWVGVRRGLEKFGFGERRDEGGKGVLVVEKEDQRARPEIRTVKGARGGVGAKTQLMAVVMVALAIPSTAHAYVCLSDSPYTQYFANPSRTIYGEIHGWLSVCRDNKWMCGETALGVKKWCHSKETVLFPHWIGASAVPWVQKCGWRLFDEALPVGRGELKRVPNPEIEGKMKVRISVSRFNGTGEVEGVDKMVKCLYGIPEKANLIKW